MSSDKVEAETQVGTPTMALMPARNYAFKVSGERHVITIPRKGTYHDLEPSIFSEKDGEFNLYDARKRIMYLPALSKVLFAVSKYPALEKNQLFAPISLVFKKDTVEISGQIIDMLETTDDVN